ncbi:sulfatase, partial [Listeria monocytogenes]|nr:sulfatase [Listeria monocytogenes]
MTKKRKEKKEGKNAMRAIMLMFDTLARDFLSNYGNDWINTPNFERLREKTITFDNFY